MRYWEDMDNKYGFNDGSAVPVGAEFYRAVYIRAVNRLAIGLGSNFRVVAFDRPGWHNWCLFLRVPASAVAHLSEDALSVGSTRQFLEFPDDESDEALNDAIAQAYELDLDSLVTVKVYVSKAAWRAIVTLKPMAGRGQEESV